MCLLQQLTMQRQPVSQQDTEKCIGKNEAKSVVDGAQALSQGQTTCTPGPGVLYDVLREIEGLKEEVLTPKKRCHAHI
jgi:hypothetical protein